MDTEESETMTEITDEQRYDFLIDLDESNESISNWEVDFLDKIVTTEQCDFSPKQRAVIDRMREKYGGEIG